MVVWKDAKRRGSTHRVARAAIRLSVAANLGPIADYGVFKLKGSATSRPKRQEWDMDFSGHAGKRAPGSAGPERLRNHTGFGAPDLPGPGVQIADLGRPGQ